MSSFFEEVFLPIAIVFIMFGLPILAFVFFRVLAHRERMAMINAGLPVGSAPPSSVPGAVPPPGMAPGAMAGRGAGADRYVSEPAQITLNKGIRLAMIGFAITLGLSIASTHMSDGDVSWHPGPWLLIGLVPMFIGIAQIIIAVLSGANVGRFSQVAAPPQAPPDPYANPVPPAVTPRSWSPDPYDIPFPSRAPVVPEMREKDG